MKTSRRAPRSGVTLLEMLIVLVLIALAAGLTGVDPRSTRSTDPTADSLTAVAKALVTASVRQQRVLHARHLLVPPPRKGAPASGRDSSFVLLTAKPDGTLLIGGPGRKATSIDIRHARWLP